MKHLNKMIANVKKMISRLIDAYGDGLLDKSEFEPRILAARERLAKLEDECRQRIDEANQEAELRLVIGQLEEFARRVSQELQEPDWDTRREVVRALVKKVEIDEQEVRIVYRVSPSPFEGGPQQGSLQHCWGRDHSALRRAVVGDREAPLLEHARVEPFADQSQEHTIAYPTLEEFPQVAVVDRIEEFSQIDVHDPVASQLHLLFPQRVQGSVMHRVRGGSRARRPESPSRRPVPAPSAPHAEGSYPRRWVSPADGSRWPSPPWGYALDAPAGPRTCRIWLGRGGSEGCPPG